MQNNWFKVAALGCVLIGSFYVPQAIGDEPDVPDFVKWAGAKLKTQREYLQEQTRKGKKPAERNEAKAELSRLNKGAVSESDICGPLAFSPLEKGRFGSVPGGKLEVSEVIGRDAVIAKVREPVRRGATVVSPDELNRRVQSAINRGPQFTYKETVIVRGIPTAGVADGSTLSAGYFEVVGTERCDEGTCFVLKPIDIGKWLPQIKELAGLTKTEPKSTKAESVDAKPKSIAAADKISGRTRTETTPPKVESPESKAEAMDLESGLIVILFDRLSSQQGNDGFVEPSKLGKPASEPRIIESIENWKYDAEKNAMAFGFLRIDVAGEYEFRTYNFYDRNALFVAETNVCPYRGSVAGGSEPSGKEKISLPKGYVSMASIGYVDARGSVEVTWKPPGQNDFSPIPKELLSHNPEDAGKSKRP